MSPHELQQGKELITFQSSMPEPIEQEDELGFGEVRNPISSQTHQDLGQSGVPHGCTKALVHEMPEQKGTKGLAGNAEIDGCGRIEELEYDLHHIWTQNTVSGGFRHKLDVSIGR
jgi:hypothetical protein